MRFKRNTPFYCEVVQRRYRIGNRTIMFYWNGRIIMLFRSLFLWNFSKWNFYFCQVSNDAGTARCTANLLVKEPPEFVLKL
ncbi:hypothetical protein ANANG_G00063890, partial [Anguilla anguilla]